MGQLIKNTELDVKTINATVLTANNSPVLTVANSTFDNVIYVAKNGNDSNDGRSMATPKRTIAGAMAIATSGTAVKVASGTYTEVMPFVIPPNVALLGDDLRSVFVQPVGGTGDMFYMKGGSYVWGITVRNYTGKAFSFPPDASAGEIFVSPYIQNVTSFTTTGTTVYIDGDLVPGANSTRAFILGFITSINRGGYGLVMVNRSYSQAVNIYTIACETGIWVQSGSFLTLNGSDNGIGNVGLKAEGFSSQFTGNVLGTVQIGETSCNIAYVSSPPRTNNGLLFSGDPNMYFITTFSNITALVGNTYGNVWNVNISSRFSTNTGNIISNGTGVSGYQVSTISASAHTFEYVGAGTNPANALPQYGGIPIPEREVVEINYGRVNWTSTDQKGDFRIGPGLAVVRATGTIEGDDFNRSLFAVMTPYILSIEG
jgi:hypothetical protein